MAFHNKPKPKKSPAAMLAAKPGAGHPTPATAFAEPAQLMPPQAVFPALRHTLDRFIGPDSDYTRSVQRLEQAKTDLAIAERAAEFESRKLEKLLRAVETPEVQQAQSERWWDDSLRSLLLDQLGERKVLQWHQHGATATDVEVTLCTLKDIAEGIRPYDDFPICNSDLSLDVACDSLFAQSSLVRWVKDGRRVGHKPRPISEDLARHCHRVLGILTPQEIKVRTAAPKAAAKSVAKPSACKTPGKSASKPAPKPRNGVDKTRELQDLARQARRPKPTVDAPKPSTKSAAKSSMKMDPAKEPVTLKAVIHPRMPDGKYKVSRRQGGHTRTMYLDGSTAVDVRRFLVSKLSIPGSFIVDESGEGVPAGRDDVAASPATPAPNPRETFPEIPDGWYLRRVNGSYWAEQYQAGIAFEALRVMVDSMPIDKAIRAALKVLSLDAENLRLLDEDRASITPGTAADMLITPGGAEQNATAAPPEDSSIPASPVTEQTEPQTCA